MTFRGLYCSITTETEEEKLFWTGMIRRDPTLTVTVGGCCGRGGGAGERAHSRGCSSDRLQQEAELPFHVPPAPIPWKQQHHTDSHNRALLFWYPPTLRPPVKSKPI